MAESMNTSELEGPESSSDEDLCEDFKTSDLDGPVTSDESFLCTRDVDVTDDESVLQVGDYTVDENSFRTSELDVAADTPSSTSSVLFSKIASTSTPIHGNQKCPTSSTNDFPQLPQSLEEELDCFPLPRSDSDSESESVGAEEKGPPKKMRLSTEEERKESSTEVSPYSYAVFYLDVPEGKQEQDLKMAIFQLGGSMSHFLSKDVTHVISNRATGHREGSNKTKTQVFSGDHSRAAMILAMAMKPVKNEFAHTNLISKALSMGIEVLHPGTFLAQAEAFLKLKDAKKSKLVGRVIPLKPPFIKVEDRSRQFRPLVREFSKWPSVKDFTKAQPEKIMKRCSRRQYCENCSVYFDNLCEHVESDLHKNVIGQEGYYERVDTLIGSMPSLREFVEKVRKKRHLKQHTGTGQGSSS